MTDPINEPLKLVENRIASVLFEKNMSRAELIDLLAFDPSRMAKIINNKYPQLSLVTAMKIARILDTPVETLFILGKDESSDI